MGAIVQAGYYPHPHSYHRYGPAGFGYVAAGPAVATELGKIAALSGPAAVWVAAAAGLVALGYSIYHLFQKYDPNKLHDTAVVEAFRSSENSLWYVLTGERLPGIPNVTQTTVPGKYGEMGINLFQPSTYPNVPYPAGVPSLDPTAALDALTQTYQSSAREMIRPESLPNIQGNYDYYAGLIRQVIAARAANPGVANPEASMGLPAWIPLAAIGALVLAS